MTGLHVATTRPVDDEQDLPWREVPLNGDTSVLRRTGVAVFINLANMSPRDAATFLLRCAYELERETRTTEAPHTRRTTP